MQILGIAGGSGAGKSTVSHALIDKKPDTFNVINLDDYHKRRDDKNLPMLDGMINWDHPDIILWDDLIADVTKLRDGQTITIETKSSHFNPNYAIHRQRIERTVTPPKILIVEGYLALYNPDLLKLFDKTFYLDIDHEARMARRDKNRLIARDDYTEKILIPMHEKYVEPTKSKAELVIDVTNMSVKDIRDTILASLD